MNEAATTPDTHAGPPVRRFVEPQIGVDEILDRLEREDAIAVPALTPAYRAWLMDEARVAPFREARPLVGRGERLVRQRMDVHDGFGPESRFHDLTSHYQALWDGWLASAVPYPFECRLVFNDLMLQVYEPGETGITPHMEPKAVDASASARTVAGAGRGSSPTRPATWC